MTLLACERVHAHAAGSVRQTNECRWDFSVEEEDGAGNTVVRLQLSKYLDSSLVDVDVHPFYVSVVIKGKVFRLAFPDEVRVAVVTARRWPRQKHRFLAHRAREIRVAAAHLAAFGARRLMHTRFMIVPLTRWLQVLPSRSKCQRSQTTGELMITAPKLKPNAILAAVRSREKTGVAGSGAGLGGAAGASSSAAGAASAASPSLPASTASSAAGGRGGVASSTAGSSATDGLPTFGSAAAGASARAGAGAAGKRSTGAPSGSARVTMLAKPSSLADEVRPPQAPRVPSARPRSLLPCTVSTLI